MVCVDDRLNLLFIDFHNINERLDKSIVFNLLSFFFPDFLIIGGILNIFF